jgi:hypothetical protein
VPYLGVESGRESELRVEQRSLLSDAGRSCRSHLSESILTQGDPQSDSRQFEWIRNDLEHLHRWCAQGRSKSELAALAIELRESVRDLYLKLDKPALAGEKFPGERDFETIVPSGRFFDLRDVGVDGSIYSVYPGLLDDTAIAAFSRGQCHSLALCAWFASERKWPLCGLAMPGNDRLVSHFMKQTHGVARYLHLLQQHPSGDLIE